MKKITIYALEGCDACKMVTQKIEQLIAGKDISLSKKFCASSDKGCDAIEDNLGSSRYPIIFLNDFSYFKEKFNRVNGIVYICSDANNLNVPIQFSPDTVGEGVLDKNGLINKLTQII